MASKAALRVPFLRDLVLATKGRPALLWAGGVALLVAVVQVAVLPGLPHLLRSLADVVCGQMGWVLSKVLKSKNCDAFTSRMCLQQQSQTQGSGCEAPKHAAGMQRPVVASCTAHNVPAVYMPRSASSCACSMRSWMAS